ncbi:MAG: glycosyl hydrolase 108 family protein [candidate division FCPU426 bacterium]
MADFNAAVTGLLVREGGDKIVNSPADSGGLTKYGICQRDYPKVNIACLTEDLARQIYRADFWDKIHGDEIVSQALAENLLDAAVNEGGGHAARWIQEIVHVGQDGVIGSATLAAINAMDPQTAIDRLRLSRIAHYVDIVSRNHSQEVFFLGWVGRALVA